MVTLNFPLAFFFFLTTQETSPPVKQDCINTYSTQEHQDVRSRFLYESTRQAVVFVVHLQSYNKTKAHGMEINTF